MKRKTRDEFLLFISELTRQSDFIMSCLILDLNIAYVCQRDA